MVAITPVLLLRAVEETDRVGALLPLADREAASRDALRKFPAGESAFDEPRHRARLGKLLTERASRLLGPLTERYPVLGQLASRPVAGDYGDSASRGGSRAGRAAAGRNPVLPPVLGPLAALAMPGVLFGGFLLGALLSILGDSQRINILAIPFAGVIVWNVGVYLWLAIAGIRGWTARDRVGGPATERSRPAAGWLQRLLASRLKPVIRRTGEVDALLGEVATRFAAEWTVAVRPLLGLGMQRMMHLGAATVAAGMIAGLYVRGIVLRYEAGWDSTFLDAAGVHAFLSAVMSPLADWAGIRLPATVAEVEQLRFSTGGGGDAAPWIHLGALSLTLLVILPRLLLALVAAFREYRWVRTGAMTADLLPYARRIFGAVGAGRAGGAIRIVPYACVPSATAVAGLERWLEARFGRGAELDLQPSVQYGDEDQLPAMLDANAPAVEAEALLFALSSTPEAENHGRALAAARDAARRSHAGAELYVVVDESGYAARMAGDPSFAARLDERRRTWRDFVAGYGLAATLLDLSASA